MKLLKYKYSNKYKTSIQALEVSQCDGKEEGAGALLRFFLLLKNRHKDFGY